MALFTLSSLGCAPATSEVTLIVAGAFQGLGAARRSSRRHLAVIEVDEPVVVAA